MTRGFLALYALLFLAFGVFAFLNPERLIDSLGAASMSPSGTLELRSNYGGVSMGIGLMCLASVFRPSLERPALFVLLAYTGGYAVGKLAAIPLDGVPTSNFIGYLVFESVTALLAFWLLSRKANAPTNS